MNRTDMKFEPTIKQNEFYESFYDNDLKEIGYGGAVGGGKSFILWFLMIIKSIEKPGIRIGLARDTLTDIKKHTMTSFYEVCEHIKLPPNFYNYNSQEGIIKFTNGSVIQFFELRYLPSDKNYTRFSGALLTFGCIEEAQGCDEKGKLMFQSRLGRWKNEEFNIGAKLLMTFNPGTNFLYQDFYIPWKNNTMPLFRKFIPAKLSDNKYLGNDYKQNLVLTMDAASKSRLLDGEWDFDNDKSRLLNFDDVLDLYNFPSTSKPTGEYYISADIAFSSDKFIIILWKGLDVYKIFNIKSGSDPELEIIKIRDKYLVDPRNIVYDADGIGKLLKVKFKYAYDFINGSKPLNGENYNHLKSQVYFKLAQYIKEDKIKVYDNNLKEDLIQEVYEIKSQPLETIEGKLKIIKKSEIKKSLGRSPDISDAMAFRMVFEIKQKVVQPF